MEQVIEYEYQCLGMLHVHAIRDILLNICKWDFNKNEFNLFYGNQQIKFSTCTDTLEQVIKSGTPDFIDICMKSKGGQSIELKTSPKTKITLTFKSTPQHYKNMNDVLTKIETSMNLVKLKENKNIEKTTIWGKIKFYIPIIASITSFIGSLVKLIYNK